MQKLSRRDSVIRSAAAKLYLAKIVESVQPHVVFENFLYEVDTMTTLPFPKNAKEYHRAKRHTSLTPARAASSFGEALMYMEAMEMDGLYSPAAALCFSPLEIKEKYVPAFLGRMIAETLITDFIPSSDG